MRKAIGHEPIASDQEWAARYVHLDVPSEDVKVLIQKVEHPSRVHLDIETDNIEAEVQRLSALGAKLVKVMERWTVAEAPTGHRFCVVNPQRPDFHLAEDANIWP